MRSRELNDRHTKAAMIEIAVYWTQLAAQAENRQCVAQHHQQTGKANSASLAPD
jgi:hypothetical protein